MNKWAICRICLKLPLADLAHNIYESDEIEDMPRHIEEFGGISLKSKQDLPNIICLKCLMLLKAAIKFRMLCQNGEKRLEILRNQRDGHNENSASNIEYNIENAKSIENIVFKVEHEQDDASRFESNVDINDEFIPDNISALDEEHCNYEVSNDSKDMVDEIEYLQDEANDELASIDMHFIVMDGNETDLQTDDQLVDTEIEGIKSVEFETEMENDEFKDDIKEDPQIVERKRSSRRKLPNISEIKRRKATINKRKETRANEKSSLPAHICCHCGNFYAEKAKLTAHMKIHYKEKPHECEICHKRFTQTPQLTRHMNSHTGNRPYKCQYCDSSFADPSTRVKHERIHTQERPYKCPTCNKAFAYSNVLKVHMMIHTGEKPFECSVCGRKFSQLHHKKAHEKLHDDD